jgi:hypothetical protein
MSLYLYGVRKRQTKPLPPLKGVFDGEPILSIPFKDIEAIVSTVAAKKSVLQEIQRRAKEDPPWIANNALCHDEVLESAMGQSQEVPVIPMKFGTVFASRDSLQIMLKSNYPSFLQSLNLFQGRREWGVCAYVDTDKEQQDLIDRDPTLRSERERGKDLPIGADYFHEMELSSRASDLLEEDIDTRSQDFFDALKEHAFDSVQKTPLSQAFTSLAGDKEQKEKQMVLNSAYLLEVSEENTFKEIVNDLEAKNPTVTFRLTGPWPPYHFVTSPTPPL